MKDKACNDERNQIKAGKTKAGVKLYLEGDSGRTVGWMSGINKSTVYNWIKKLDKKTESSACSQEQLSEKPQSVDVIEMDELYSFVERKNRFYAITLVNRDIRGIVGLDITFGKSRGVAKFRYMQANAL